ncbi:uncharacterized protein LOC135208650 [Macrobrachium nipponense]|uniref:uncharacterized protein LOC135208650 n=1 Tax=Macrobrachium nipponense TaxID=159736 RepID=UPI0030C7FDAF
MELDIYKLIKKHMSKCANLDPSLVQVFAKNGNKSQQVNVVHSNTAEITCFNCKRTGHMIADCSTHFCSIQNNSSHAYARCFLHNQPQSNAKNTQQVANDNKKKNPHYHKKKQVNSNSAQNQKQANQASGNMVPNPSSQNNQSVKFSECPKQSKYHVINSSGGESDVGSSVSTSFELENKFNHPEDLCETQNFPMNHTTVSKKSVQDPVDFHRILAIISNDELVQRTFHTNEINDEVEQMLEGVIRKSNSPYNFPLIVVPKKDWTWQICLDFRRLNEELIPDRLPVPCMDDILFLLGQKRYFTNLDLLKGFHQLPLAKESTPYTAFSTARGHYEFLCMPFGLRCAPITFTRMINIVFGDLLGDTFHAYMDDLVIFSHTLEEHLHKLELVLQRLRQHNLRVKISKCEFFKTELVNLGFTVSSQGLKVSNMKLILFELVLIVQAFLSCGTSSKTKDIQSSHGSIIERTEDIFLTASSVILVVDMQAIFLPENDVINLKTNLSRFAESVNQLHKLDFPYSAENPLAQTLGIAKLLSYDLQNKTAESECLAARVNKSAYDIVE